MTKKIDGKEELRKKILSGVAKLSEAVGSTLGPRGRNVIVKTKGHKPIITKDGVTVSRAFELEDTFENLGVQIIKQSAESTVQSAGDGTTTSTVLANAILIGAQEYINKGYSPVELKRGIDKTVDAIIKEIKEMAKPIQSIEEIEQIATISANGDEGIGKLIATAVDQVGKDGAITIKEGRSNETSLELTEGFQFDSGMIGRSFITDERRGVMRYENCLIFVTDKPINCLADNSPNDVMHILQLGARDTRPLIIIAEDISEQPLAAIIMNKARGTMKITAIKAPRYGEERRSILEDLSIAVGATFFSRESGRNFNSVKLSDFGEADIVEASLHTTTIVGGKGDDQKIQDRIEQLKNVINATDNIKECERIQERITRLASGIAIIKVGASTEVEMVEKKHRIEDSLEAVKSAQEEGIIPGGGTSLILAAALAKVDDLSKEQEAGEQIVKNSVKAPLMQMLNNAGLKPISDEELIVQLGENKKGFNVATGEFVNMLEAGIIDPVKVTRSALQNAASAAGTLITTNFAIVEEGE